MSSSGMDLSVVRVASGFIPASAGMSRAVSDMRCIAGGDETPAGASRLDCRSVAALAIISLPAPSGRMFTPGEWSGRVTVVGAGGVKARNPTVGAIGIDRSGAFSTTSFTHRPEQFTNTSASNRSPSGVRTATMRPDLISTWVACTPSRSSASCPRVAAASIAAAKRTGSTSPSSGKYAICASPTASRDRSGSSSTRSSRPIHSARYPHECRRRIRSFCSWRASSDFAHSALPVTRNHDVSSNSSPSLRYRAMLATLRSW